MISELEQTLLFATITISISVTLIVLVWQWIRHRKDKS